MNISTAAQHIRRGKKARRQAWDSSKFISYSDCATRLRTETGAQFQPTIDDLNAEDWEVVEENSEREMAFKIWASRQEFFEGKYDLVKRAFESGWNAAIDEMTPYKALKYQCS